jgi:putative phage-type endonuclease
MDAALAEWLLDSRPCTHLNHRIKQFVLFCRHLHPDVSYNSLHQLVLRHVDAAMQGDVGRLWMRDRAFERVLRDYGNYDQRTAQWFAVRSEMITASEVYKAFGSPSARRELILGKLERSPSGEGNSTSAPLIWGTRLEPVAKRIFEERTKCKVHDVACVRHPRIPYLGASPDGLIEPTNGDLQRHGRLVEFKCPFSRVEKEGIPPAYYHQMQLQMECTGIDECEYVEFRFKQVNYTEWQRSELTKGVFSVDENGKVNYNCTPKDASDSVQLIYWVLVSLKEELVLKDPLWLTTHEADLASAWAEVVKHRAAGTKPEAEKSVILSFDM